VLGRCALGVPTPAHAFLGASPQRIVATLGDTTARNDTVLTIDLLESTYGVQWTTVAFVVLYDAGVQKFVALR
jgi:hypothetical protein